MDDSPLETINLTRVSEDQHQELDRVVLDDFILSQYLEKEPSSDACAYLLSVIIDTCKKSVDLDGTYGITSEAKRLVNSNASLMEELKDAWKIQKFARIRSLEILQRYRPSNCNPRLPIWRRWITISLIRHAQSVSNVTQEHQQPEEPLTVLGEKQAETIGQCWSNVQIDHFFSSPFKRAHMTAQAIARHNPQAPAIQTNDMLVEQDAGEEVRRTPNWDQDRIFQLMTGQSRYRYRAILQNRHHRPPGGGESYADVAARAKDFLLSVLKRHGVEIDFEPTVPTDKLIPERFDERIPHVVVVSHGIFLMELYETILFYNAPFLRKDMDFDFENTSMRVSIFVRKTPQ